MGAVVPCVCAGVPESVFHLSVDGVFNIGDDIRRSVWVVLSLPPRFLFFFFFLDCG